jgi:hypothetical protein
MGNSEDGDDIYIPPRCLAFFELHGARTQKTTIFITTTMRNSNPGQVYTSNNYDMEIIYVMLR